MSPRYDDEWVARILDTDNRLGAGSPHDLLAGFGLAQHHTLVDLGCGPGFFALPAATIVGPQGRVYAVDVEQKMLDLVDRRATSEGHRNIRTVLGSEREVPLSDKIADRAICALALHYPSDPAGRVDMVQEIARLLRPGGRVLIINWVPQSDDDSGTRMSAAESALVLRQTGFEPDEPQPLGEDQYTITATRLPSEGDAI